MTANLDYALIGNCASAALISPDCSIDWLCLPFFDSPSLFASILDRERGGYWKIAAEEIMDIEQSYVYHTAIVKTVFRTRHGVFEVRDYMPRFHTHYDQTSCPCEVQRDIHLISGTPRMKIELRPRPNYGYSEPHIQQEKDYIKITSKKGEYNSFYLYTDLDPHKVIHGEPMILTGSSYLLLSYHEKLDVIDLQKIYVEYEKTKSYWLDWVFRTNLPDQHKEMVIRSMITLKLLMYERTGAVIAAPTTSLPEIIGKDRNWDYRYCWVRDASMIIDLSIRLGHVKMAERYINFILNRMLLKHENVAVVYGINGERMLTEKVLDYLDGYEGSKPVRVGNDAYRQKQNDLYGELIETVYTFFIVDRQSVIHLGEDIWTAVRSLVNTACHVWRDPDCGIWERRGEMKHYVHSKLMNWVAMDRAMKIAKHLGRSEYANRCSALAAQIKESILTHGWSESLQSFTMSYGSHDLDAANLLMLHYGFLDRRDPRIVSTVRRTYESLVRDGFAMRYVVEDESGRPENAFIVCTFWMINALYLIGEEEKAREMFVNVMGCANRLGLFSEDVETATRRLTGNFPQGYSHLAFIQTVLLLETDYNWSDATRLKTLNG
jgi:GH15 family glucan-1,4-alpha-glucosidase